MAADFEQYLETTQEMGEVVVVLRSIVLVAGLPTARLNEVVVSRLGAIGQVVALNDDVLEVLMLRGNVNVGDEIARTDARLTVPLSAQLLGRVVDPLGEVLLGDAIDEFVGKMDLEVAPPAINSRADIERSFETGVALVDLLIPLGIGQRELVLGDRRIGKSWFIKQAMVSHVRRGGRCVYAAIAKRQEEIASLYQFVKDKKIVDQVVIVATSSADPAGLIYQTPYAAQSIAEWLASAGGDVLIVFDDLSIHAKTYREIMLLAKRFPGRSSYPGDIFYAHARLLERAGNFATGSITALPVAETVLSDMSGYITTNLMSMTDGHIFFDTDLFNQGRRPAINPFLSVTRVGHQAQTPLFKEISRDASSFLVAYEQLKSFSRFGGDVSDSVKQHMALGEKMLALFDQTAETVMPASLSGLLYVALKAGLFQEQTVKEFRDKVLVFVWRYEQESTVREYVEGMMRAVENLAALTEAVTTQSAFFVQTTVLQKTTESENQEG